ncbi:MAG: hypothetical protein ACOCQ6_01370, partial [Bacteroidota bacterium]
TTLLKKELTSRNIQLPEISAEYTQTDLFNDAMQHLNMNSHELTLYLWEQYQPQNIWIVLASIGVFTGFALILYNFWMARRKS